MGQAIGLTVWRLFPCLKLFKRFSEHLLYPLFLFKKNSLSKLLLEGTENMSINGPVSDIVNSRYAVTSESSVREIRDV